MSRQRRKSKKTWYIHDRINDADHTTLGFADDECARNDRLISATVSVRNPAWLRAISPQMASSVTNTTSILSPNFTRHSRAVAMSLLSIWHMTEPSMDQLLIDAYDNYSIPFCVEYSSRVAVLAASITASTESFMDSVSTICKPRASAKNDFSPIFGRNCEWMRFFSLPSFCAWWSNSRITEWLRTKWMRSLASISPSDTCDDDSVLDMNVIGQRWYQLNRHQM